MAEWEVEAALASENQRQAKLIVMEAIAAAERRGWKRALEAAADHIEGTLALYRRGDASDRSFGNSIRNLAYPEKE